ncbi:DNA-3-methyladenine glycosylase 2 family protein [Pseudoclavibacter chungangensis]|uniref:DNA-3-methyladenine glycosylase 2 family protein n=2 Tax=Pseudoclavibacter chungangensis TaxID=587635 RepID=A0A7J5BPB8_9MICO|nr:DNA-3-methyladenine glycosylase 2 family protein [Pseudoclavibacter chungangensis]
MHDEPRVVDHYEPREPVDLHATLSPLFRGQADPTYRVDATSGDVWRTCRTELGGATVCFRQSRTGVRIVAWGPGAERAVELAPELLGRGDDWSGLDLRAAPWLAEVRRRNPGLRLLRTNSVFDALAPAVLEQKVTGLEAHRAWRALHLAVAQPAPGPVHLVPNGMTLPLSPDEWRHIPSWRWHRAGVDRARSSTIVRAAPLAAALERTLDVPGARSAPGAAPRGLEADAAEEVTRRLRSLPGVGVWTAAETTQRSHGDPDAPSFGDYHLAAAVGWAFTGGPVDDDGMRELLEPWRGHRQRIMRLLSRSGRGKPRRGPRMTVQDHRDH